MPTRLATRPLSRPVAYGLILGDCVVGSFWAFVGLFVGHSIYQPWAW